MRSKLRISDLKLMGLADLLIFGVSAVTLCFGYFWGEFLITVSGWTSLGALIIANALIIKMVKAETEMRRILGGRDVNKILVRVDTLIDEMEAFFKNPAVLALIDLLVKTKTEGGGLNGNSKRA